MKLFTLFSLFTVLVKPAFSQNSLYNTILRTSSGSVRAVTTFLKVNPTYHCTGTLEEHSLHDRRPGSRAKITSDIYWYPQEENYTVQCYPGARLGGNLPLEGSYRLGDVQRIDVDESIPSFSRIYNNGLTNPLIDCASKQFVEIQRAMQINREVGTLLRAHAYVNVYMLDNSEALFNSNDPRIRPSTVQVNSANVISISTILNNRGSCLKRSANWIVQKVLEHHSAQN